MAPEGWTSLVVGGLLRTSFAGEWGDEPSAGGDSALVLRATNFSGRRLIYETAAKRALNGRVLAAKELRDGDLLLEGSGGSPEQPVGRVALFSKAAAPPGRYVCSNFFRVLRIKSDVVLPEYAEALLQRLWEGPGIRPLQRQTTGIINLDFHRYLQTRLSVPTSLSEQRAIVQALHGIAHAIELVTVQADDVERLIAALRSTYLHPPEADGLRLDDLAAVNPPTALSTADAASFVPMAAVSEEGRLIERLISDRVASQATGYTPFVSGDTLLAKITPCFENGKAARFIGHRDQGFGSTEFHVLRPKDEAYGDLVLHLVHSAEFRHRVEASMTGSAGQRRVSAAAVSRYPVPSSIVEQRDEVSAVLAEAVQLRSALLRRCTQLELLLEATRDDLLSGRVRA